MANVLKGQSLMWH